METAAIRSRVELLIRALKDPHVSVVWNATRDLALLGAEARDAIPALTETLHSHDPTSRLWARYALARITGETALHLPVFIAALSDKKGIFPGMASAALAALGPEAREAVPLLIRELKEANPEYRWSAAGALANIGPEAVEAVPALAELLAGPQADPDEKTRWYAAWALGEIGPEAHSAVPALIDALDDIDDDVRGYAALALGKIGGNAVRRAVPILQTLCEDENEQLRVVAEATLARLAT